MKNYDIFGGKYEKYDIFGENIWKIYFSQIYEIYDVLKIYMKIYEIYDK